MGCPDVDERRLHARQDVLDPAEVDVAVYLGGVIGGTAHVVLDERPALEHGDLRRRRADVDDHEVAAQRAVAPLRCSPAVTCCPSRGRPGRCPRPRGPATWTEVRAGPASTQAGTAAAPVPTPATVPMGRGDGVGSLAPGPLFLRRRPPGRARERGVTIVRPAPTPAGPASLGNGGSLPRAALLVPYR